MRARGLLACVAVAATAGLGAFGMVAGSGSGSLPSATAQPDGPSPMTTIETAPAIEIPTVDTGGTTDTGSTSTDTGSSSSAASDQTGAGQVVTPVPGGAPAVEVAPQHDPGAPGQAPLPIDQNLAPQHPPIVPEYVTCVWPWQPCWPTESVPFSGPSVCISAPPPPDAPPPPPFEVAGQLIAPHFDQTLQQWGFWHADNWVPGYAYAC